MIPNGYNATRDTVRLVSHILDELNRILPGLETTAFETEGEAIKGIDELTRSRARVAMESLLLNDVDGSRLSCEDLARRFLEVQGTMELTEKLLTLMTISHIREAHCGDGTAHPWEGSGDTPTA